MTYPNYTYSLSKKSDPVNIVFKNTTLKEICLVLTSKKWKKTIGGNQTIHLSSGAKKNDEQIESGSYWKKRFHMRLWKVGGDVVASVHYEQWQFYKHEVFHFEGAEKKVSDDFNSKKWTIRHDVYKLNDINYTKYNNGKLTIIEKI